MSPADGRSALATSEPGWAGPSQSEGLTMAPRQCQCHQPSTATRNYRRGQVMAKKSNFRCDQLNLMRMGTLPPSPPDYGVPFKA